MELGRLDFMDQAQVDYVSKISKIQETDKKTTVDPDEQYKNVQNKISANENEVILNNVEFGYNTDTKDFFVRITKGDAQYQYPTEDMMNLKKSLMEAYSNTQS